MLAESIKQVCVAHAGTCDLANPDSPSSTVAMLRRRGGQLKCLALADSPIVVRDRDGSISVVEDDRAARLPGGRPYTRELVRTHRNQPDGLWVASITPAAAYEAVTATFSESEVGVVAMLTDGVTRLVDHYGYEWSQLLDSLVASGPTRLIELVRDAERTRPGSHTKPHDDATALFIDLEAGR